mmetsp:Transcript_21782/g.28630  ORF Transcript_21782/g.28630 Transcript_21782/m.28630 type:complete len:520 (+) Transcript_21782:42-1601(+)|eukprot:CAMPEP_0195259478 /NCGR_PEP_ID=MMETSP0706-20130129/7985_1 /TAXON_ID=33640 /ORGANISM="Asterionellopsis glacialis, Strain CCMP134" /LENGTH=519 /DNA_ID=CAMNT_0040312979 /DNA_START=173 /DNA_END=1732 /DNA_ORIENTATION=-
MGESKRVSQIRNKLRDSFAKANSTQENFKKMGSALGSEHEEGKNDIESPPDGNGAFPTLPGSPDEVFGVFHVHEDDGSDESEDDQLLFDHERTPSLNGSSHNTGNNTAAAGSAMRRSSRRESQEDRVDKSTERGSPKTTGTATTTGSTSSGSQSKLAPLPSETNNLSSSQPRVMVQTPHNINLVDDVSDVTEQHSNRTTPPGIPMAPPSMRPSARRPMLPGRSTSVRMPIPAVDEQDHFVEDGRENPATVLKNLFVCIEQERHMNKLAGLNLRAVNNWLLFLPAILTTLLAGIMALISESELKMADNTRVIMSISVGILALCAALWQAMSKQLELGSRAALHEATAIAMKRLTEDVLLRMSSREAVPIEYVIRINEKFCQALETCGRSVIPFRIEAAFAAVQDRMVLILRPPTGKKHRQFSKEDFMQLYSTVYDELSSEIIHYWGFPFQLPRPRIAADNAVRSFKNIITEGREVSRGLAVFGKSKEERSLFDVLPPMEAPRSPGSTRSGSQQTNMYSMA